jgi:outer membrane receptor for ferrienterochelin and colicins
MRHGVLLAGVWCLGTAPLAGQAPQVVVEVRDSVDARPIPWARLTLSAPRQTVPTDFAGRVTLVPAGLPDTLIVRALGYRAARVALGEPLPETLIVRLAAEASLLPDIVTTAGRRERRSGELTVATVTIDRREIEAQAATAVDQVVGELPGVQVETRNPAGSTLLIRGLGESRVLVLVDGEPVGGALLENRDLSRTSTLAVERIEVTKGPGSVEHGSDALGGVINVVTAPPEGPLRLVARGRAGSLGRREGDAALSRGGAVGFRLAGGWRQSDQVAGHGPQASALERVWDLRGTLRSEAHRPVRFRADAGYDRTRQRWPVDNQFNGFVDTWNATGLLEAAVDLGPASLRSRVVGQYFKYRYRQSQGTTPVADQGAAPQTEETLRGVVAWSRPLGRHLLDLGVEGTLREVRAEGYLAGGRASDRVVEAYAQDGWELGNWYLNGGARFSYSSRWGGSFTPSVGVAGDLSPGLRWRASVARGFRAPSFKELAWDFPNLGVGYVVQGNPDLDPERSWSMSTGATWTPGEGWRLGVDLYRNALRDLIDFRTGGFTGGGLLIYRPENVARARTEGLELELRRSWGNWITAAGYEYLHARDLDSDLPLDGRSAHTARLRLTRLLGFLAQGALDLTGRFTGEAPLVASGDGGPPTPAGTRGAFMAMDLRIGGDLFAGLGLEAGVDNVLDDRPRNWPGTVERRFYIGIRGEIDAGR